MSEKNTALSVLTGKKDAFELKKLMYNLATSADTRLSSMVNKPFIIKGVTFAFAEVANRETGELEQRERALVIDADGNTYHSVAGGLVSSLHNFVKAFGEEQNGFYIINEDIPAVVEEKATKNGHTYILKLVD
ncbi:MAG: hypothetical protein ACLR7Q_09600 [Eubacterium sp.]|jgi:hypothetical protein